MLPLPIGAQKWLLDRFFPGSEDRSEGVEAYQGLAKLERLFGADFQSHVVGKAVLDFGCGTGNESIAVAAMGARSVIGLDIREDVLEQARANARRHNVNVEFTTRPTQLADVILSVDAFEHFDNPGAILQTMAGLLKPGGIVLASFGPTWYHPLGGHLFSVFPWSHLLFDERALIAWRSGFKSDGARRFNEVAGGLNQISIAKFRRLVAASPFVLKSLKLVPIRPLRFLHNGLTEEFTTAIIQCQLELPHQPD